MRKGIKYSFLVIMLLMIGNGIQANRIETKTGKKLEIDKKKSILYKLEDGRSISYLEYGDTSGTPVVYCHGHPGSRLEWASFDLNDKVSEYGIRLIAIDRPGTGNSDYIAGNWLDTWPEDMIQLVNHLGVDSFGVLGVSGGAPYALAIASKYPERVSRVVMVSGMGPKNAPNMKNGLAWNYAKVPSSIRKMMLGLTKMGTEKDPDLFTEKMIESLSQPDAALLTAYPKLSKGILEHGFAEALKNGTKGVSHEAYVYKKKWPFELKDIRSKVYLWHGTQDANVPYSVGEYLTEELPNCVAVFAEGEGHLTTILNFLPDYLTIFRP
jgi:pimeloyl-ACP methyl ester carboxylesterase